MKRASKWTLRILAGAVMFMALGGPAPGTIGGCGSTVPVMSSVDHCTDFEKAKCDRDHYAMRIDDQQYSQCVAAIATTCSGSTWPPNCSPTPAQSKACVNLLLQLSLADQTTDELLATHSDCNLCPDM